jgi:hypothetical protein
MFTGRIHNEDGMLLHPILRRMRPARPLMVKHRTEIVHVAPAHDDVRLAPDGRHARMSEKCQRTKPLAR